MHQIKNLLIGCCVAVVFAACSAEGDHPGYEYAPNMYHSVAYEPFREIKEWNAGRWLTSIEYEPIPGETRGHGEFYTANNWNPHRMNMRVPPAHTVSRNPQGWLPYTLPNDTVGLRMASRLQSPLPESEAVVAEGKLLYETYCGHCHGPQGKGNGKVAEGVTVDDPQRGKIERKAYAGVANLTADAYKNISEGHIFHVITYGKGLMMQHASQVETADRWKIARYVKTLQK